MSTGLGRYAGVTTVIAALAATAVVALAEPGQQTASDSASVNVALTDDDGGQPMFVVPEMAPGETVRRCVTLRYSGNRASRVSLTADVSGALADRLELTVARGTGGSFDDCKDFSGTTVYEGSLGDAAAELERAETWRATGEEAVAYRFTIEAPTELDLLPRGRAPHLCLERDAGGDRGPSGDARARHHPGPDGDRGHAARPLEALAQGPRRDAREAQAPPGHG